MKIREAIKEKVISWLMKISHKETEHLYNVGKLDWENYTNRLTYPQTWWMKKYIPLRVGKRWFVYKEKHYHNPLHYILTGLCGILTGHEKSNTEYGYGGGKYIDRNCRWCDKVILELMEESQWAKEGMLSDLIADMRDGQAPTLCEQSE